MSYIWEGPEPLKQLRLKAPKVDIKETTDGENFNYIAEATHSIRCEVCDTLDNEICKAIVDAAEREGVTDLFLIDKEFIMTAIKNEMVRRKAEVVVRPDEYPPTYMDIYNQYRLKNPTDAKTVVDYRPARPPYYDECIPETILLYHDKNDSRKTSLYTYEY